MRQYENKHSVIGLDGRKRNNGAELRWKLRVKDCEKSRRSRASDWKNH